MTVQVAKRRVRSSMWAGAMALAVGLACGSVALSGQASQTPAPAAPAPAAPQGGRGGGFGRGGVPPQAYDDYTGFTRIWDGSTFANWDGERDVWSIENGLLHADTTRTPGQHHIHYKGPGAVMRDFDLKVEFKLSATGANGGIQYRGRLLHASHGGTLDNPLGKPLPANVTTFEQAVAAGLATAPAPRGGGAGGRGGGGARGDGARGGGGRAAGEGAAAAPVGPCTRGGVASPNGPNGPTTEPNPWQVSGYQFDLDSNNVFTGQLYEGQGRGIVTAPGTIAQLLPGRQMACLGTVADAPATIVKPHRGLEGEWNQVEIVVRGNTLIHILNGRVISVTIDDNPEFRALQGILSLQLEGSGQVWYRNVYLKPL